MDHIAIMTKKWKLLPKVLDKTKTIESRWYVNRIAPWNKVKTGDTIYFKNSGEAITVKAKAGKVLQFSNLDGQLIKEIYKTYGRELGLNANETKKFTEANDNKNYCILIVLENPRKITPFHINKKGFGSASAWLCVKNIKQLTISTDQTKSRQKDLTSHPQHISHK